MAAGGLSSVKVEVEFVAGTWTDVSAHLAYEQGAGGQVGRPTEFDDIGPATWDLTLRNADGRFTPDNPLSPHWPNVVRGRRLRFSVTRTPTTWVRHVGRVTSWDLEFPESDSTKTVVRVSSADPLATPLGTTTLRHDWVESVLAQTRASAGSEGVDLFELTGEGSPRSFPNLGIRNPTAGYGTAAGTAVVHKSSARGPVGAWSVGDPGGGLALDGALELAPNENGYGPVLRVTPQSRPAAVSTTVEFHVKVPTGFVPALGLWRYVLQGVGVDGKERFSLRVVNNGSDRADLWWYDTSVSTGVFRLAAGVADDVWRHVRIYDTGSIFTDPTVYVDDEQVGVAGAGTGPGASASYQFGGFMGLPGKQNICCPMSVAGIAVTTGDQVGGAARTIPGMRAAQGNGARWAELTSYVSTLVPAASTALEGSDDREVLATPTGGRTVLEVLQELARTIGGYVWWDPATDKLTLRRADVLRTATSGLTVGMETDADADPKFTRAAEAGPTRVTVTSPAGTAIVVDVDAEADGSRREETVDTCAATIPAAENVAAARMWQSTALRLASLPLDLVTTATDRYAAAMALKPGARVSTTGQPAGVLGFTAAEVHVQGWNEEYGPDAVRFVFDSTPADAPAEALFDTARFDAEPGQLEVNAAATAGATSLTVDAATGAPSLTQDAAAYPMVLDVAGERVTVTAAPAAGGAGATQTLTVTRGTSPSVARAHAVGDDVTTAPSTGFAF